jgi:hypothetical protein
MKKNKIILLILVTLLFSGCTVNYSLYINDDLSVNESVTASENSYDLKTTTGQDPKVAASSLYDLYKIKGVKYDISTVSDDSETSSVVTSSFDSLEDYQEHFKSDIVNEVSVTNKDGIITIEYKQDVPLTEYASKALIYDSIEVNIEVPFKVTKHNADSVKGNTYTWNIKKDGELKDIKITFNSKETNLSKKINILGFFEINIKYSVLFVVGLIVIALAIVGLVYRKSKKNNIV